LDKKTSATWTCQSVKLICFSSFTPAHDAGVGVAVRGIGLQRMRVAVAQ